MSDPHTNRGTFSRRELDAWRGFLRVHAAVVPALDIEMRHLHGLSLSAYEVLISLEAAPEGRLRMTDISSRLLVTPGGVTRIVDRLVGDGLVLRVQCDQDHRGFYAELTDAGRELIEAVRPLHHEQVREAFLDRLTPEEQGELGTLWTRLLT